MIVSCPACGTSFAVDDSLIGPSGRKVRCAKCSHRWHQMPVLPQDAAQDNTGQEKAAAGNDAPATPAIPTPSGELSASEQMSAIAAAIAERLATAPETGAAPPAPPLVADVPPQDIPSAVIRPRPAKGDDKRGAEGRPRRRRRGLLILGILLGIVIAVPAAGYVWRGKIARSAPWAQDMYTLLGIRTDDPMEDLELANIKIVQRQINDKPAVEITGDVFNKAQYAVEVPMLRATPLGTDGKPMPNAYRFRLQEQVLEPGQTASFRVVYDGFGQGLKGINVDFDSRQSD